MRRGEEEETDVSDEGDFTGISYPIFFLQRMWQYILKRELLSQVRSLPEDRLGSIHSS
jgi:hypothetical protein